MAFPLITAHFFLRGFTERLFGIHYGATTPDGSSYQRFRQGKMRLAWGQQIGIGVLYLEGAHRFVCAYQPRAAIILIPLHDLPSAMFIRVVWKEGIGALLRTRA